MAIGMIVVRWTNSPDMDDGIDWIADGDDWTIYDAMMEFLTHGTTTEILGYEPRMPGLDYSPDPWWRREKSIMHAACMSHGEEKAWRERYAF